MRIIWPLNLLICINMLWSEVINKVLWCGAFQEENENLKMAQSSIVLTLRQNLFKRNVTACVTHSPSIFTGSRSLSSLSFSQRRRRSHTPLSLSAPFSSPTAMGETPVTTADAGMDAVQRRLMFEDESVPLFSFRFSIAFVILLLIDWLICDLVVENGNVVF